jgi:protein SCO1/2
MSVLLRGPLLSLALSGAALLAAMAPAAALAGDQADPHAHCKEAAAAAAMKRAKVSTASYTVPRVTLVRDDGKAVTLAEELADGRPVVLDFIFTTCTTICPIMSQTFTQLQEKLGDERERVHLVSISIDPDQDTPERLAAYAAKFRAGSGWRLYTGSAEASVAVQRAFEAYRGDKMSHTPVTFLRAGAGRPWVRIDGFASAEELARALHDQLAQVATH